MYLYIYFLPHLLLQIVSVDDDTARVVLRMAINSQVSTLVCQQPDRLAGLLCTFATLVAYSPFTNSA